MGGTSFSGSFTGGYQPRPQHETWKQARVIWPRRSEFSGEWILPGQRAFWSRQAVKTLPRNAFHHEKYRLIWATNTDLAMRRLELGTDKVRIQRGPDHNVQQID